LKTSTPEELWRKWAESGKKPEHLEPLINHFQPSLRHYFETYKRADISPVGLEIALKNRLLHALNTYNPEKGSLSTHVHWNLRGVSRHVERFQNVASVPANKIYSLGKEKTTLNDLAKGKVKPYSVIPVRQELDEEGDFSDVLPTKQIPKAEIFEEKVIPKLSPQERKVVVLSREGKGTVEIAKELGVSPARVSKIKVNIEKQYRSSAK
jgi:RNA polymerase sigma factor (sigma-70 family)